MKQKRKFLVFLCVLILLTGCGDQKLSEVTQEELDAVEPQGRIVHLFVAYYVDFSSDYYYSYDDWTVRGGAIYDTGQFVICDFPPSRKGIDLETCKSHYTKEYIYDYLMNMDMENDEHISEIIYIEPSELTEYIIRLDRIDMENTETSTEDIGAVDDAAHEVEHYGVRYEKGKPVFLFLHQKIEQSGKVTYNTDVEAQRAFEIIDSQMN